MCGIAGAVSQYNVAPMLLDSLKRLAYRGYDSAGMAVIDSNQQICCCRVLGKVLALQQALEKHPLNGKIGIAHTRWATHGSPSKKNAHPHLAGNEISMVHNGIVENHEILRKHILA